MKKSFTGISSRLLVALCVLSPLSSYADHLQGNQRKELFIKGTVTDQKTHQTWDVILVPGISNITNNAGDGFAASGKDFADLSKKEFWKNIGIEFKDGFKFSKDVIKSQWVEGIDGDYKGAVAANKSITPGEIGSGFEHVASWTWFGIKAVARTAWMPVGVAGGVAYSVAAPVATVAEKPVIEGVVFNAATRGVLVPAVLYVWNGIAWTASSIGNVPTQESFFVHLKSEDQTKPAEVVIDDAGFASIVAASVVEQLTADQRTQLQEQVKVIQAEIDKAVQPLQKQQQDLQTQQDQAQNTLSNNPAEKAVNTIRDAASQDAPVSLSQDAKDTYLDQAKLRALVISSLQAAGVTSPDSQAVDTIVAKITQTLQNLHVKMAEAATKPTP